MELVQRIRQVTVLGAGQMGSGIAQTLAQSGYTTALYDISDAAVERGMGAIASSLDRLMNKGRLSPEQRDAAWLKLTPVTTLDSCRNSDFVIEAVPEQLELKQKLFRELDRLCPPETILATNTSSLSITVIAGVTKRPSQVIGMHFMNPVPLMPLVEVIRGLATSEDTLTTTVSLAEALGKTAIRAEDYPGFISNRILMPMINEAVYAVYEGVASPEAVDQIMKLGMNHPMGPLTLADFIGLDTCLSIMETLQEGFGDSKYRPCPLLRNYVSAGWLGKKTGRGFYSYD
ncbi:3-hydroxybutyryl-CoA dehydrogenase [Paenibacillus glycanilyticus]|uniref:3-hydroxyacyl-CoA dehydrogenase family protein n=1 Tax=Paenibacillus glycanilyticus TaxID=126569 RepID=UPI00203E29F3|nr:3-hydroxybutyryl-CoA dehydrogenase [Paenibacillus glycanilyticus]MCM3628615.1 3-hydroxybutyryl-CoA dehydrogenase [Paenibacillus glycanilyticus]